MAFLIFVGKSDTFQVFKSPFENLGKQSLPPKEFNGPRQTPTRAPETLKNLRLVQ